LQQLGYRNGSQKTGAGAMIRSGAKLRLLIAISACFLSISCSREITSSALKNFNIAGYDGHFEATSVWITRDCSWFECGESTIKTLDSYYQFQYLENGEIRTTFPLIRCERYIYCGSDKEDFRFCGDRFVPVAHQDVFDVGRKSAATVDCKRGPIIRAI
jgi:hypothetical protein